MSESRLTPYQIALRELRAENQLNIKQAGQFLTDQFLKSAVNRASQLFPCGSSFRSRVDARKKAIMKVFKGGPQ